MLELSGERDLNRIINQSKCINRLREHDNEGETKLSDYYKTTKFTYQHNKQNNKIHKKNNNYLYCLETNRKYFEDNNCYFKQSLIIVPFITMTCLILAHNCHTISKNFSTSINNSSELDEANSQAISTFSSITDKDDIKLVKNLSPSGNNSDYKIRSKPSLRPSQAAQKADGKQLLNNNYDKSDSDDQAAQMLIFDDDDSLNNDDNNNNNNDHNDDDDDDEDEEENFYNQNPVDSTKGNSFVKGDLGADIKVYNSDFKDFDDHDALRTFEFYPKEGKSKINTTTAKRSSSNIKETNLGVIRDKPNSVKPKLSNSSATNSNDTYKLKQDKYLQQESYDVRHYNNRNNLSSQCALILERGLCITYGMVEWALQRARNVLQFESTEDLNSAEPSEATINSIGELNELTTRILAERFQLTWSEIALELGYIDVRSTSFWRSCPAIYRTTSTCLMQSRFRTHTGQCNNLLAPHLGSSYMPFMRIVPADYADGIGIPRRSSLTGNELPPPRLLALYLHPDIEIPSNDLSGLFVSWGQLVNHDLAMASGARPATGHSSQCCRAYMTNQGSGAPTLRDRICLPIQIGQNDPVYGPTGIRCLDFKRSLAGLRPGCSFGPRIQLNTITSFVDASFVYGSRRTMTEMLRRNERGLLNTWQYFENLKPLLPPQEENPDEECINRRGRFCFLSGDARTNQQIQLAALHTYHTRQHNRLARALRIINPHWPDNRLYHEARHIHIAIVQHILLNEYLPILLGEKLVLKYNLKESEFGKYWDHYNPSINPSISQAFAAAAFRQGHTTVPSEVYRFNNLHELIRIYKLRELFRQPWPLYEPGAMDQFLLGMLNAPAQSFDPFISIELSGHLLQEPGERVGLDLTAINIQRGRDQGVASYNVFREWCGLKKAESFSDLLYEINNRTTFLLEQFYESVHDIDLFTGGISEYPLAGAQVGPTFACIIGRQFEQLRAGDRFWFESSMGPQAFTIEQLESIKQVSLARLLCANSDNVITIQPWAFHQPHPILNPRVFCNELPDLDITLWMESPNLQAPAG